MVDASEGLLGIDWIEGRSVKTLIPSGSVENEAEDENGLDNDEISLDTFQITIGTFEC